MFKICLVYVDPDKFTIHARGGDDLNKITVSRLNGFPNLYLEPKEFSVVLKRCKELNTKGKCKYIYKSLHLKYIFIYILILV